MSKSGNKINYNLRPSKSIERKMVVTVIKLLFKDFPSISLRYIGMGSNYFNDFKLFHKELNISNMINLEVETSLESRLSFNKPYRCIQNLMGKSTDLLPNLNWDDDYKDFFWMDYDGYLEMDVFSDIEIIFSKISPKSFYLMSCNKQLSEFNIDTFKEKFENLAPIDLDNKDFTGERDYILITKMVINKINETINIRNSGLEIKDRLKFYPLLIFTYKDGANMVSIGGFLDLIEENFTLNDYHLDNLEYIRTEIGTRFKIDPPNLTYKEIIYLNGYLPNSELELNTLSELHFIPESDKIKYLKLYKFFPNYMDVFL